MKTNNLQIVSRQKDVTAFYNEASLVLNLSDKECFVETFGLTALEAMTAGLPVIVPTEGGIAEMVVNGVNGYKIDVQELDKIAQRIQTLFSDMNAYKQLANGAYQYSQNFRENIMIEKTITILNS